MRSSDTKSRHARTALTQAVGSQVPVGAHWALERGGALPPASSTRCRSSRLRTAVRRDAFHRAALGVPLQALRRILRRTVEGSPEVVGTAGESKRVPPATGVRKGAPSRSAPFAGDTQAPGGTGCEVGPLYPDRKKDRTARRVPRTLRLLRLRSGNPFGAIHSSRSNLPTELRQNCSLVNDSSHLLLRLAWPQQGLCYQLLYLRSHGMAEAASKPGTQ